MSSSEAIGGYFELELPPARAFPHASALLLNNGRACLEYVLRANRPSHLYIPKYTCDVMLEPLVRTGVPYSFYSIDQQLELSSAIHPGENEYLLYTNYFGLKDDYCRSLASAYGRSLVLDCSQALFFDPPAKAHAFYSVRKFVGVPDGACLYTDRFLEFEPVRDRSAHRFAHLIERLDRGAEAGYPSFKANDAGLSSEPLKAMSPSTERILGSINFESVRRRRLLNFTFIDQLLQQTNRLHVRLEGNECPMVYPYLSANAPELRRKLNDSRIFVATYWPNVFDWCAPPDNEFQLAQGILPLPIDQRYGPEEMTRIASILL